MWLLKIKLKHNCVIGDRCEKYGVISYSMPLSNWKEKNIFYTSERHTIEGEPSNVKIYLEDIKKDRRLINLEISGNTLFYISKRKDPSPSSFYSQKVFFTKPVFVDKRGYELWEVASHDKRVLAKFLENLEKEKYKFLELLQFKNVKLNNIFFPAIAPNLTEKQRKAFELAISDGYYDIPKRTDLKKLAKKEKVSTATFQEHLKRAEAKIIPKMMF